MDINEKLEKFLNEEEVQKRFYVSLSLNIESKSGTHSRNIGFDRDNVREKSIEATIKILMDEVRKEVEKMFKK